MNRYLLIIKNEVKEALSESKNLIFLLFVIFIASVVLGIIFHDAIYDSISPVIDNMVELGGSDNLTISWMLNNIRANLLTYFLSRLFAFMAFFSIIFNGLIIGVVGGTITANDPSNWIMFLALILPHGIFEIPSLVFSSAGGIFLFKFIFNTFKTLFKNNNTTLKESFLDSWDKNKSILKHSLVLLILSLVLMVIAGIIEGNFTLMFGKWIQSFF